MGWAHSFDLSHTFTTTKDTEVTLFWGLKQQYLCLPVARAVGKGRVCPSSLSPNTLECLIQGSSSSKIWIAAHNWPQGCASCWNAELSCAENPCQVGVDRQVLAWPWIMLRSVPGSPSPGPLHVLFGQTDSGPCAQCVTCLATGSGHLSHGPGALACHWLGV